MLSYAKVQHSWAKPLLSVIRSLSAAAACPEQKTALFSLNGVGVVSNVRAQNPKVLFCRKSLKIYRHPMVKTQEMKQTAQRLAGDLIGQQSNSWVSLNRSTRILPDLATSPQRCHHLDMLSKARLKEEPPETV